MAGSSLHASLTSEEISKLATPLLFGTLVNWGLYGALCVQTYVYFYNFPNDELLIKFLVFFVFALETAQTALTGADIYYRFIAGFGNFERLSSLHYGPVDIPIMNSVIALLIQMYFCSRIWTLTKNVWPCVAIAVSSMVSAIGSAWGGFESILVEKFAVSKVALYMWSVPTALVDIMIATAMTLLLRRIRASDGLSFTRFVLVRVVRLTIETNALTGIYLSLGKSLNGRESDILLSQRGYLVLGALCHLSQRDILCIHANVNKRIAISGQLYSNTLLVSLNNRIYFRDHSGSSGDGDTHFAVTSRVRTTGTESVHFASVETQSRSHIQVLLETSSYTRDMENGQGNSASIDSDPRDTPGDVILH